MFIQICKLLALAPKKTLLAKPVFRKKVTRRSGDVRKVYTRHSSTYEGSKYL